MRQTAIIGMVYGPLKTSICLRPFGIVSWGCQPRDQNLLKQERRKYWDVLIYARSTKARLRCGAIIVESACNSLNFSLVRVRESPTVDEY